MAAGKVIGQIQVSEGNIKIVGVDGTVREPGYEGYVYENEQVVSTDANALFQIKFLALPEAVAYDGIFKILADGSVIYGRDAMESVASDESLGSALKTASSDAQDLKTASGDTEDLETAAGEEGAEGSSSFTETDIVASSSVLGFFRGTNGELGFGITDFGSVPNYDAGQIPQPVITSPNVVIYDENDTIPVIQVTATAEGSVTYSIAGLDSEHFNIDANTGLVTFKESPDFENPKDAENDNEYNMYVTVTDTYGNYTTQLLSVSVNNVNEPVTAYDDNAQTDEDSAITFTAADILGNDKDIDEGDELTISGVSNAVNGTVVLNEDGTVTFTPNSNYNGDAASFEYTVTDGEFSDTGVVNIDVTPVNDLPTGTDNTVTTAEDTAHTFTAGEFGFIDAADSSDTLASVKITSLETVGTLKLDGEDVTLNQVISVADINDGLLTFTPAANQSGTGYDSFEFAVVDNNGGVDETPQTMTIDVTPVNDLPTGTDNTVTTAEDTAHAFTAGEFGFIDAADSSDTLASVKITSLETVGTLKLDGEDVTL
ncbi:MAG: tandem-95 repeat protein, partial [Sulfurimonas sp.]|uniref:tandem-95 repeat protein n=1 Tax=Sulfurimonas sp. TaxID=2022749 RepID=UPI00260225E0